MFDEETVRVDVFFIPRIDGISLEEIGPITVSLETAKSNAPDVRNQFVTEAYRKALKNGGRELAREAILTYCKKHWVQYAERSPEDIEFSVLRSRMKSHY